jgi:hypothetical protein
MNKSFALIAAAGVLALAGVAQAGTSATMSGSGETSMTPTTTSGAVQAADSRANDTRSLGAGKAKKTKVKKMTKPMAQTGSGETSMTPTTKN